MYVAQLLFVLALLLGKATGGERGIAQTSVFYKAMSSWAREVAEEEMGFSDLWDYAMHGRSSLEGALHRAIIAELAELQGRACAAIFWDFQSYFDSIEVGFLAAELSQLHCPTWAMALVLPMHATPRAIAGMGIVSQFQAIVRSILQGCALASLFARSIYRRHFRRIVLEH